MDLLRSKLQARGHHLLRCSDAPDMTAMNNIAAGQVELGREALQWYQQAYRDQQPLVQRAADRADQVSLAQLDSMRTNTRIADDYDRYRRTTFQPLEEGIVRDAQNFDTEAERERLAGLAGADTAQAFGGARDQFRRDVGRSGVNPADGAYGAGLKDMAAQEALATAYGKNKARSDATTLGRAMKMDAASLGRNLPSNQATSAGLALSAGNSAAQTGQMPVSLAQGATQMGGQGYGTAIQANQSAGNLYGQAAQIQQRADDSSGLWGVAGQALGAYIGSDKKEKTDIKPMPGQIALSAVRSTPVSRWRYRPDSKHADGGRQHAGPMAGDVKLALGDAAAPDGKVIDSTALLGVTLAAVKQLDRKVVQLSKEKASPRRKNAT